MSTYYQTFAGKRFGRLVVLGMAEYHFHKNKKIPQWSCLCDCGKTIVANCVDVKRGSTTSCGCRRIEGASRRFTKHGATSFSAGRGTPEWTAWKCAKARTSNPRHKHYQDYGGRGIKMCERWRNHFVCFLQDMGLRPAKMSLDRKDNNGHYSCGRCPECSFNEWPSNCRWANQSEQLNNQRRNQLLTLGERTQTLMQWSREVGLEYNTLRLRIQRGWPVELALTKPSERNHL